MAHAEFERKVNEIAKITGHSVEFNRSGVNHAVLNAPFTDSWKNREGRKEDRFYESVSIRSENGRLNIYGWCPNAKDGSRFRCEENKITVSQEKTAQQIAKDMARRFFPAYRQTLNEVVEQVKEYEVFMDNQASCVKALAGVCGVKDIRDDGRGNLTGFYLYNSLARGEVKVSGGSVTIELRGITGDQAKAVLEALKG